LKQKYDLTTTIKSFETYAEKTSKNKIDDKLLCAKIGEAQTKLRQIDTLLEKIEAIESEMALELDERQKRLTSAAHLLQKQNRTAEDAKLFHETAGPASDPNFERWDELILYVECFYYIAFRTLKIVKDLPKLKGLSAKKITLTRNQLIEHPNNIFSESARWSKQKGVQLRSIRQLGESTEFVDEGLVANLSEFQINLQKAVLKTPPN